MLMCTALQPSLRMGDAMDVMHWLPHRLTVTAIATTVLIAPSVKCICRYTPGHASVSKAPSAPLALIQLCCYHDDTHVSAPVTL